MRDSLLVVFACASLIACTPVPDTAYISIFLPPPYDALPAMPLGPPIEPDRPVSLITRQQQASSFDKTRGIEFLAKRLRLASRLGNSAANPKADTSECRSRWG